MSTQHNNSAVSGLRARLLAPEAVPPSWSFIEVTNAFFALLICLALMGPVIATLIIPSVNHDAVLLGWNIGAVIAIFFVFITRLQKPESLKAMRLQPAAWPLPFNLLLGLAGAATVHLAVALVSRLFIPPPELSGLKDASMGTWILAGAFVLIFQPVAEELTFRGVILPWLRHHWGATWGFVICAGAYAIFHWLLYPVGGASGNAPLLYGQVYPLMMGLFFCGVRVYTGSTQAVILAHIGAAIFAFFSAPILL